MFVKTIKIKKIARILGIILAALVIALAVVYVFNRVMASSGTVLSSEADQAAFLKELGWKVSEKPIDVRSVIIPQEWNDVYAEYNKLQLQQGFDLDKYRGKNAEIYTYEVYNYGDSRPNIVANLIICDSKLIGGDVCCTELGGFMQGLAKAETTAGTL